MAERRQKLIDPVSFAYRTGDLLVTENQELKVILAFRTMIFKDGHDDPPCDNLDF
jgi:hypothetical protein